MKYRVTLLAVCLLGALCLPVAAVSLTAAEAANSAPIAENLELTTYKNVAINGQCAAVDPEGDLVTFQLVDKPARGQVALQEDGYFCYTPYENKKGKDTFTYVAVDANGNISQEATVKVTIEKPSTSVSYSDMAGETSHYAAIRLAERGIYVGEKVGDTYCFSPDDTVTREEFLAMAMTAADADALKDVTLTGFYDDDDISAWAKGYVSAALLSGTVQGSSNEAGQTVFNAGQAITATEAAVIIDRLLAMGDVATADTFSQDLVPTWAYQAVVNMDAVDVVSMGSTCPIRLPEARLPRCSLPCWTYWTAETTAAGSGDDKQNSHGTAQMRCHDCYLSCLKNPTPYTIIFSTITAISSGLAVIPSASHFSRSPITPALT